MKKTVCCAFLLIVTLYATSCLASPPAQKTLADLSPRDQAAVSEAIGRDRAELRMVKTVDGYRATNDAHHLTASFLAQGARLSSGPDQWMLTLHSFGREGALRPVAAAVLTAKANRVEYRRGDLTEWYVNGPAGLEQGFTVASRPAGAAERPLVVEMTGAGLAPKLVGEGMLALTRPGGGEAFRYGKLAAWDADGRPLPVRMALAEQQVRLTVDDHGARYPVTIDPMFLDYQAPIISWIRMAVSGDDSTLLIHDSLGIVYKTAFIYTRSGTTWTQQAELAGYDHKSGAVHPVALSADGNTALIGNNASSSHTGAVFVYTRSGTTWSEPQQLLAPDGQAEDQFGYQVALSADGNTALISAHRVNNGKGAAYVFTRSGNDWSQQQKIDFTGSAPPSADLQFSQVLALSADGNTALIGTGLPCATYPDSCGAFAYKRSGTTWTQEGQLKSANPLFQLQIHLGTGPTPLALSADGNTALVGSVYADGIYGEDAVYVFTRSGSTWSQQQRLTNSYGYGYFGDPVSLSSDGTIAVVGMPGNLGGKGAAIVFKRSASGWYQMPIFYPSYIDDTLQTSFGSYVQITADNSRVLVASSGYDSNSNSTSKLNYYKIIDSDHCDDGNYMSDGVCTPCPAGSYASGYLAICIPAPAGSFVTAPTATPTPCPAGTYQPNPGQASCLQAPAGSYVPLAGAAASIPCPAGTYQPATGQTSCIAAPAGSFVPSTGATGYTACTPGTLQPASGQAACVAIPKAITSIQPDPANAQHLYTGVDNAGVYFSSDGGTSWTAATTQPANNRVKALVLTPGDSTKQYAATYGGGVYKSSNSGVDWSACATTGLTNLNLLSLTIDSSGKLYAGSEAGVFVSNDNCATWTAINSGLP